MKLEVTGGVAKNILAISGLVSLVSAVVFAVFGFIAAVLYQYWYDDIWNGVRENLGIRTDNVISVLPHSSYASEPVAVGDEVVLNYTMRRTEFGGTCLISAAQAVFIDETNRPTPGEILTPLQNLDTNYRPVRTTVKPNEDLVDGRVRVAIHLQYTCGGVSVSDSTPTIVYKQTEATNE